MNAAASSQEWFRSKYFLIWSCGSVIALIYVPAVTIAFRHSPLEVRQLLAFPLIEDNT